MYIYICIHYISWYPTFYPETSWNLIKPYSRIFRPSAKLQVAKKETMMAVRGRVQLHSGHLFGGQDGNMLMMLWVWLVWVLFFGLWALTTQRWKYETSRKSQDEEDCRKFWNCLRQPWWGSQPVFSWHARWYTRDCWPLTIVGWVTSVMWHWVDRYLGWLLIAIRFTTLIQQ